MLLGITLMESYSAAVSYAGTKGLISFLSQAWGQQAALVD